MKVVLGFSVSPSGGRLFSAENGRWKRVLSGQRMKQNGGQIELDSPDGMLVVFVSAADEPTRAGKQLVCWSRDLPTLFGAPNLKIFENFFFTKFL